MTKEEIIHFLQGAQQENGEFQSFCYLPQAEQPRWYYSGDSPFVTGNVLFALRNIVDPTVEHLVEKGLDYLALLQEKNGLWRYWAHNNGIMEYNVPCDVDDTALVYFLNHTKGRKNPAEIKDLLLRNQSSSGDFYTWFIPNFKHLKSINQFKFLVFDLFKSRKVFLPNKKIPNREAISSIFDNEPAVNAHVVMALGEHPSTEKAIRNLVDRVENGNLVLQYYDHPFFVYHHLSRAFKEGVHSIEEIRNKMISEIVSSPIFAADDEMFLLNILNLITLSNLRFNSLGEICEKVDFVYDHFSSVEKFVPYKYWTSKQRSWWAGSSALTAALYLEFVTLFPKD